MDKSLQFTKDNEGYRQFAYDCTAGKQTIGIGFNLTDVGISEDDQSMTFAGNVPTGYVAQLMRGNFESLIEGAELAAKSAAGIEPPEPDATGADKEIAILVSCIVRKLVLGQRTVEEVEAVVATAKWHPLKGAYLQKAIREDELPSEKSRAYLERRHKHTFVIIGIESVPAYENLDNILAVGNIGGVFIGPNDMSTSLGIPDDYSNPQYVEVVRQIIQQCEAVNVPVMVHQQTYETSTMAIELGARFVLHAMDSNILQRALQNEFNALRKFAGEVKSSPGDTVDVA